MTSGLSIKVLGRLEIDVDGHPVKIPEKCRALLAYLACQKSDPSREVVADLLWPQQTSKRARHSLRNCLFDIRMASRASRSAFVDDRRYCRMVGVTSDISEFRSIAAAQTPTARILNLYRGQLLDGFDIQSENFADWLSKERRSVAETVLQEFSRLASRASAAGAHETAIRAARLAVEIDELDESSHRQLIVVLLTAGRRAEAVRFLGWVRDTLDRELGEQPSERTTALLPDARSTVNEMTRSMPEIPRLEATQSALVALLEETLLVKTRDEFVALRSRIRQALAERKPAEAA